MATVFLAINNPLSVRSFNPSIQNRRDFFAATLSTSLAIPTVANADIEGITTPSFADPNPTVNKIQDEVQLFSTKSGLKYIILQDAPQSSPSPRYGNLLTISYKASIKLPGKDASLQQYDSDNNYLIKHGNGRIIPGLDEGLHSMQLGEKRRIIIPPKLGYVGPGVLGPLPASPYGRYKLNQLLDKMIDVRGGNLVLDVELKNILVDEADQGYYEDGSLTPEEFSQLRINLQEKAKNARNGRGSGSQAPGVDLLNTV